MVRWGVKEVRQSTNKAEMMKETEEGGSQEGKIENVVKGASYTLEFEMGGKMAEGDEKKQVGWEKENEKIVGWEKKNETGPAAGQRMGQENGKEEEIQGPPPGFPNPIYKDKSGPKEPSRKSPRQVTKKRYAKPRKTREEKIKIMFEGRTQPIRAEKAVELLAKSGTVVSKEIKSMFQQAEEKEDQNQLQQGVPKQLEGVGKSHRGPNV